MPSSKRSDLHLVLFLVCTSHEMNVTVLQDSSDFFQGGKKKDTNEKKHATNVSRIVFLLLFFSSQSIGRQKSHG